MHGRHDAYGPAVLGRAEFRANDCWKFSAALQMVDMTVKNSPVLPPVLEQNQGEGLGTSLVVN